MIQGETGVGKTMLLSVYSELVFHANRMALMESTLGDIVAHLRHVLLGEDEGVADVPAPVAAAGGDAPPVEDAAGAGADPHGFRARFDALLSGGRTMAGVLAFVMEAMETDPELEDAVTAFVLSMVDQNRLIDPVRFVFCYRAFLRESKFTDMVLDPANSPGTLLVEFRWGLGAVVGVGHWCLLACAVGLVWLTLHVGVCATFCHPFHDHSAGRPI